MTTQSTPDALREAIALIIDPEAHHMLNGGSPMHLPYWIEKWDDALAKADEIIARFASLKGKVEER